METNLYYAQVFRRQNVIKEFLVRLFISVASLPRLLLEVWVRKNFGERYFSFSTSIILAFFLVYLPFWFNEISPYFMGSGGPGWKHYGSFWQLLADHWLYYLFILGFVYMAFLRRQEIKHLPSVFDFARMTLSQGDLHPMFLRLQVLGITFDIRTLETIIEPAFFLVIGYALSLVDSMLGALIVNCSILYSMSYFAAYHVGDNFMMDIIDSIISSEEMNASIVEGKGSSQTRGFSFTGRKPSSPEGRTRVSDYILHRDEFSEVK